MSPIWIKTAKGYVRIPYEHMQQDSVGRWYFHLADTHSSGPLYDFLTELDYYRGRGPFNFNLEHSVYYLMTQEGPA